MSFRDSNTNRYGHVPPVQYPVANQQQDAGRRSSFNNGDDSTYFNNPPAQNQPAQAMRGEEELFLTSPVDAMPSPASRHSFGSSASAMSGYQHTYQAAPPPAHTPSTYNPQTFARAQSQSLPYHPHPASNRYGSPTSSTGYTPTSATSSYAPQAYNPAAYANTAVPQRQPTYHGYGNYSPGYGASASQVTPTYGQSPGTTYAPSFPSTYEQPLPSPPQPGYGSPQPAAYDPSGFAGSQYGAQSSNGGAAAPYPQQSQIPVGPNYSTGDPNSFYNRPSRSNSQTSPIASPPAPPMAAPGLQRHPTNAPLPSRPLENVSEEAAWNPNGGAYDNDLNQEQNLQDNLFNDIEAELGRPSGGARPMAINGQHYSDEDLEHLRRYNSNASTLAHNQVDSSNVSRFSSNASTANRNNAATAHDYDDESDPEGTAGVLAMQQAELEERRFSGSGPFSYPEQPRVHSNPLPPPPEEQSSDSDFGGMDLGMFSGGFAGNLQYDNNVASPPGTAPGDGMSRPLPVPQGNYGSYASYQSHEEAPAFRQVEMDYGGTGGLHAPSAHRMSFDEDEEHESIHSRRSGSESPYKDDYPDMFYHPGLINRPLPALPPVSDNNAMLSVNTQNRGPYQHGYSLSADSRPLNAESGDQYNPSSPAVERSISMNSHSTTPHVQAPARSRTDAAEERKKMFKQMSQQQQYAAQQGIPFEGLETGTPSSIAYDEITIPSGRRRKFTPSKLTAADIRKCEEPWALSGIAAWIREMADGEPDLKTKSIEEAIVNMFTGKVPTMNVADAETLSALVVELMLAAGILVPEEEWVKFGPGSISGVLPQLTGAGCYAPRLHDTEGTGRCYSHHCGRTLKKANLDDLLLEDAVKQEDWATFYKLSGEKVKEIKATMPKKEIERQNVMHEIITSEEVFMNQLEILRILYRDQLKNWQPPIITPNKLDKFLNVVFGKVDNVQAVNKDNLLAQLKYRQQEQGPWISGFSDLFREWIRKARTVFMEYSSTYPYATYLVRKESDRNLLFRQFLDNVRNHKRSERLDWTHYLKTPITRLQRYSFLLEAVEKCMTQESEEKTNLAKAIEEIRAVTLECDTKVAEMQKKVEMMELNAMLVLRPGFHSVLNLDHLGRELIHQGDLQRMGSKGVRWLETHALLFDHYFILAKVIPAKDSRGEKKYDVSKEPIPMPLLFLESNNDDPVAKQKGITAPLGRTTTVAAAPDTKLNKVATNGGTGRPLIEHTTTSSSLTAVTRLAPTMSNNDPDGKILYPFKIKHLGHEIYTLFAPTQQARDEWCNKIIEAKTRHAKALFSQNAEPFRLRVLADSAFAYDAVSAAGKPAGVSVRGTPLDRAIRELEKVYGPGRGPAPVCRAQVNCACSFSAFGKSILAIGTDYGVYISDASDPRGWQRTVQTPRVTQIAVLEEFSVCLIIADRSLISYPLDVVAPISNFPAPSHDNTRRAPQRLAKDVSFFATARMKERMLLFYKRKEGMHNTFKVLEPVFNKSTEKKSRLFSRTKGWTAGSTETFRDFDEFYLPTECFSLNLFQTYIAVSTAKGIELLTLDKKQTMSIPDLKQPAIANIAGRIRDQRPLGMFRLNDQEFLLTYEDCAVYVDKHGEVSRTLIMEYSGKQRRAKSAAMYGQYLVLFNDDYVEVRNAENGRLRQIVAGRDVRCLDYGGRGPTPGNLGQAAHPGTAEFSKGTVKIAMSHPEIAGMQIVLEMLLNDGHTETG